MGEFFHDDDNLRALTPYDWDNAEAPGTVSAYHMTVRNLRQKAVEVLNYFDAADGNDGGMILWSFDKHGEPVINPDNIEDDAEVSYLFRYGTQIRISGEESAGSPCLRLTVNEIVKTDKHVDKEAFVLARDFIIDDEDTATHMTTSGEHRIVSPGHYVFDESPRNEVPLIRVKGGVVGLVERAEPSRIDYMELSDIDPEWAEKPARVFQSIDPEEMVEVVHEIEVSLDILRKRYPTITRPTRE